MHPHELEVGPHDSASQVTSASRGSQSSSRVESEIRKEGVKKAGLLAKVKILEKKQQLEDSYLREQFGRHEAGVKRTIRKTNTRK